MPHKDKNEAKKCHRKWYEFHKHEKRYKEQIAKNHKKYRAVHRDEILIKEKEYDKSEKGKERHRRWALNNPQKTAENRRKQNIKNKESGAFKRWHLKKHYGLTYEEFNRILSSQNNRCGICKKIFTNVLPLIPCVDHIHDASNKIRGLLCKSCNSGIGFFKEDVEILRKAEKYVSKHRTKRTKKKVL